MNRKRSWLVVFLCCGALAGSAPAGGTQEQGKEEPPPKQGEKPPEQEGILDKLGAGQDIAGLDLGDILSTAVGAGGELRTGEDEPPIVSIISEQDIRLIGARSLAEVLETLPGFEVLRDNLGRGRVVLRGVPSGLGSQRILVLLNGWRLNEGVDGGATVVNLDLPVDNVKKIEIVRGPGSVQYGPGALEAVINVVTENVDTFRRDEISLGGGSFNSIQYNFRYGTTLRGVSFAGFVQFDRTDGPGLTVPEDAQTMVDRGPGGSSAISQAPGTTLDDRKGVEGNLALAYKELKLTARLREENAGGFIGLVDALGRQNRLSNKQISVDAHYGRNLGERTSLQAQLGFSQSKTAQFLDVLPPGFTVSEPSVFRFPGGVFYETNLNARRVAGEARLLRQLFRGNSLVAGVSLEREATFDLEAVSNIDIVTRAPLPSFQPVPRLVPSASRRIAGVYLEDTWNPGPRLGLTAGVRLDDYSDFGTAVTPRAGLVWRAARGVSAKLAYGRGFRAPSFLELYFTSPGFVANPGLGPEKAHSFEANVSCRRRELQASAGVYLSRFRDLITLSPPAAPTEARRFVSTPGLDAWGFDVQAERGFGPTRSLKIAYSYQHSTDVSTGARLPDVPAHLAYLAGSFGIGSRITVVPGVRIRGERPRAPEDPRAPLEAYALFDLALKARNVYRAVELSAVFENVFDRRYFDPSPLLGVPGDYPRPGRRFFVKARYQF